MSGLTDEQAKVNKITAKGLSLNQKIDLYFNELHESMKRQLGEEFTRENVERLFNSFFRDEEKLEIRKAIQDFLFEGYEDRHQIIATTKKYHKLCSEILKNGLN